MIFPEILECWKIRYYSNFVLASFFHLSAFWEPLVRAARSRAASF